MGKDSSIEWCHHTHNLWHGCTKIAAGCKHCYAETWSRRSGENYWGASAPRRFFKQSHYRQPYAWDRSAARAGERHRVFCGSMMDLFEMHSDLAMAAKMEFRREQLFYDIIPGTQQNLDWLFLTKRLENMLEMIPDEWFFSWPRNVWLGFSASTQDEYLAGTMEILKLIGSLSIHPPVIFVSLEPLVGPVNIAIDPLSVLLDQVIVSGESGKNARAMHPDWARRVRDDCIREDIPFFFKQWGNRAGDFPMWSQAGYHLRRKKGGDILDGRKWQQVPEVQENG